MQFSQVIGEQTPEDIEKKISRILATGEPVELPEEIVRLLLQRRQQATQQGGMG